LNKKALFIIGEDVFFASHRLALAIDAKKNGYEVAVLCRSTGYKKNIIDSGVIFYKWNSNRSSLNPFSFLSSFLSCFYTIKNYKPDVINAVGLKQILILYAISPLIKCKNILYVFSGFGTIFTNKSRKNLLLKKIIEPILLTIEKNPINKLVVQNKDDFKFFSGVNGNIYLIPGSGVDLKLYASTINKPKDIQVILPARMIFDKGVVEFVEAAKILKLKGVQARFILIGPLDSNSSMCIDADMISKWVDEGIVEYQGYQENMLPIYTSASILCLPSYREGLPKALIEGAACGIPAVVFDTIGCRDIVENEINGYVVKFGDTNALANAILQLISSKETRDFFGREARRKAEKLYGIECINKRIISLW